MSWWRRSHVIRVSMRGCVMAAVITAAGCAGVGGALYAARGSLLTWVGRQLIYQDPLTSADAIIVLSGGVPHRELEAADLYRSGVAPLVALTYDREDPALDVLQARGVAVERLLEQRQRILRELGVAQAAIAVIDPVVDSTVREAGVVADWAQNHNLHRLVVVTSPFHTGRVNLAFRAVLNGRGIALCVRAARSDTYRADSWWLSRVNLREGLIEWQKQVWYRLRY